MSWTEFVTPEVKLAESDSESKTFGLPVARLSIGAGASVDPTSLKKTLVDALANYKLIIARWESTNQTVPGILSQAAMTANFELIPCPTLIYWGIDLDHQRSQQPSVPPADEPKVRLTKGITTLDSLIAETFRDYPSHYAFNPYLPKNTTELAYRGWVKVLSLDPAAQCQIIYSAGDAPAGIGISKQVTSEVVEVLIAGIAETHQNQGLYQILLTELIRSARNETSQRLVISTQASNIVVQRVWARVGLRPILSVENCHLISGRITS
jgi:RimJ/RimL family protein N-acetyltransferase